MNPSASVVIPAFNEAGRIAQTIKETKEFLEESNYDYEIIVVNDGSADETEEVISSLSGGPVKIISRSENRGKGAAIQAGVKAASKGLILFMDADNATKINDITGLREAIQNGADIAIGSRRVEGANIKTPQPLYRVWIGRFGNLLIRVILGLKLQDTQCGFKLFKKEAAKELFENLKFPRWSFDYEILYKAKLKGMNIKECPITWEDMAESKFSPIQDTLKCTAELIKIKREIK